MRAIPLLTLLGFACAASNCCRGPVLASDCSHRDTSTNVTKASIFTTGTDTVTMTAPTQIFKSVMYMVEDPEATIYPTSMDDATAAATAGIISWILHVPAATFEHIADLTVEESRERYQDLDWKVISHFAWQVQKSLALSYLQSMRFVLGFYLSHPYLFLDNIEDTTCKHAHCDRPLMMMRGRGSADVPPSTSTTAVPAHVHGNSDITAVPTTIGSIAYVQNSTLIYDPEWAVLRTPMMNPPACTMGRKHKKDCLYSKCLRDYYQPMNFTTVFQAIKVEDTCPKRTRFNNNNWYTQPTAVTTVHWGSKSNSGLYYPHTPTVTTDKSGNVAVAMKTIMPEHDINKGRVLKAQGPPTCWNRHTCCEECHKWAHGHRNFFRWDDPLDWHTVASWTWLGAVAGVPLGLASLSLFCCCLPLLKRRKSRVVNEKQQSSPESYVIQNAVPIAVTPTADAATAPGSEAGQGTLGRRAEEGRGQVHFDEPAKEAAAAASETAKFTEEAPKVFTTHTGETVALVAQAAEKTAEKTAGKPAMVGEKDESVPAKAAEVPEKAVEHVETVPAPHDGASDAHQTGSQIADMGSMRGRKRNKQGGRPDLLNFKF
jgi:hypothetical protein